MGKGFTLGSSPKNQIVVRRYDIFGKRIRSCTPKSQEKLRTKVRKRVLVRLVVSNIKQRETKRIDVQATVRFFCVVFLFGT